MMRKILTLIAVALLAMPAVKAQDAEKVDPTRLTTADIDWQAPAQTDSLSRAIGTIMGANVRNTLLQMGQFGIGIDRNIALKALSNYLEGTDTGFTPQQADSYLQDVVRSSIESHPDTVSVASQQAFLAEAAQREGATATPSGLVFEILTEGEGAYPTMTDEVTLTYTGKLADGTIFDQTTDGPVTFPVNGVVPGFAEGLQMMRPGGTYRLVIPAALAYGEKGIPGAIPGNSALDFTITLVSVK